MYLPRRLRDSHVVMSRMKESRRSKLHEEDHVANVSCLTHMSHDTVNTCVMSQYKQVKSCHSELQEEAHVANVSCLTQMSHVTVNTCVTSPYKQFKSCHSELQEEERDTRVALIWHCEQRDLNVELEALLSDTLGAQVRERAAQVIHVCDMPHSRSWHHPCITYSYVCMHSHVTHLTHTSRIHYPYITNSYVCMNSHVTHTYEYVMYDHGRLFVTVLCPCILRGTCFIHRYAMTHMCDMTHPCV